MTVSIDFLTNKPQYIKDCVCEVVVCSTGPLREHCSLSFSLPSIFCTSNTIRNPIKWTGHITLILWKRRGKVGPIGWTSWGRLGRAEHCKGPFTALWWLSVRCLLGRWSVRGTENGLIICRHLPDSAQNASVVFSRCRWEWVGILTWPWDASL